MSVYYEETRKFENSQAIVSDGKGFTYAQLHHYSDVIARHLLFQTKDLNEARIAFMVDPSFAYTYTQWGIWKAGGIAIPICVAHPLPSIQYVLEDTGCSLVLLEEKYESFLKPLLLELNISYALIEQIPNASDDPLPAIEISRKAMILYTSGTTSLPKGVVTTHQTIKAQIETLVHAWHWTKEDKILNVLPLHHVHGIINVMSCALYSGASCTFLPKFDAAKVWEIFTEGRINMFMAVPTIYYKLIQYWDAADASTQNRLSAACKSFRLMVSGSAALPVSVLEKWKTITGHTLLERYGMTEIGMGLSNPYDGERRPGHVGIPLPGVHIRLFTDNGVEAKPGESGEIQVKGSSLFLEYWRKPAATKASFTEDGWFQTGDIAILNKGYYKILGRNSVDIIKSGGYKISALEIEEVLRTHPDVNECGVVGIPDKEWGEIVAAAVVLNTTSLDKTSLQEWMSQRLPKYRIPRLIKVVDSLPRNTLGKITKNHIKSMFTQESDSDPAVY